MREITVLKVGLMIESNGSYVLNYKPGAYPNTSVVLCFWPTNIHHPFVVWTYNELSGFCEHGDYYRELTEGVEGFAERGF